VDCHKLADVVAVADPKEALRGRLALEVLTQRPYDCVVPYRVAVPYHGLARIFRAKYCAVPHYVVRAKHSIACYDIIS